MYIIMHILHIYIFIDVYYTHRLTVLFLTFNQEIHIEIKNLFFKRDLAKTGRSTFHFYNTVTVGVVFFSSAKECEIYHSLLILSL